MMELFHPQDLETAIAMERQPRSMMVLLTEGSLLSEGFCRMLMMAQDAWNSNLKKMLPVRSETFRLPSGQALQQTIGPRVAGVLCRDAEEVVAALKRFFSTIAVSFTCTAGIATLNTEIANMLDRLNMLHHSSPSRPSRAGSI